jgi:serine/threonine-protein kinase
MGEIYTARDTVLNRPVAVKFLSEKLVADATQFRHRFVREATLLSRLEGAGLPLVLDRYFDATRPFLVMELVEGETLAQLLERGRVESPRLDRLALELASMLSLVHRGGVIHRDLKPANLMIDRTGRLRLLDLGLAKDVDMVSELTATGNVMGTWGYMAPEQELGEKTGPAADIYAFGVILYELATGRPLLQRGRRSQLDLRCDLPPASLRQPELPAHLVELIARCLSPEIGPRPGSFAAIRRWLTRHSPAAESADYRTAYRALTTEPHEGRFDPTFAGAAAPEGGAASGGPVQVLARATRFARPEATLPSARALRRAPRPRVARRGNARRRTDGAARRELEHHRAAGGR